MIETKPYWYIRCATTYRTFWSNGRYGSKELAILYQGKLVKHSDVIEASAVCLSDKEAIKLGLDLLHMATINKHEEEDDE